MKYRFSFVFFLSLWIIPSSIFGGDGNYQNYIVGEQAAGMGGAVTALCRSVDACFYNPAGLADSPGSTISLSASLYGFYNFKVTDGWLPDEDVDINSFVTIPSTFGSIMKLDEDLSVALSAFVPDRSSSNDLETFSSPDHFFKYNKDDQSLWIGPSIGYRVTPDLSIGVSIFGVYRTFSYFRDWFLVAANTGLGLSADYKYNDLSLLSVLGTRYNLSDTWAFALTVQTPTIHLSGDGEYLIKAITPEGIAGTYIEHGDTRNSLPTTIRAGLGCRVPQEYAFGLDLSYHFPTSFNRLAGDDQDGIRRYYRLRRLGTMNVHLGGEYYVRERYPVRLGFFTNLSSAPKVDIEDPNWEYPPHIDKYGITLSVGRETEHTTLNLGINYVWGEGDFYGYELTPDSKLETIKVKAEESYLYIFLASSYLF